jgi:hypothetical protein
MQGILHFNVKEAINNTEYIKCTNWPMYRRNTPADSECTIPDDGKRPEHVIVYF